MKDSSEYKDNMGFALLLQGPPKTGKSSICMSFPDPWFADCDGNLASAVRQVPGRNFYVDTIDVDDDGNEIPEKDRWTRLVTISKAAALDPRPATLCIDSLSKVAVYLVDHILASQTMGKDNKEASDFIVGGEKMMTMRMWGPFKVLLSRYIFMLRASGKYVVVTCHEEAVKDKDTGSVLAYRPLIPSSLKEHIGAMFTDVWRTEVESQYNIVRGAAETTYSYKVRCRPTNLLALGTSLKLPATFSFSWDELSKHLLNLGAQSKLQTTSPAQTATSVAPSKPTVGSTVEKLTAPAPWLTKPGSSVTR